MILLYVLNDSSNESTYILPSNYQELIQYLNLPSFDMLDSFIQNHLEIQLFSNVTLNNIITFNTLLKAARSTEGPSCILTHSLLESSIIMPLPEDHRVLNYFCHRFVPFFYFVSFNSMIHHQSFVNNVKPVVLVIVQLIFHSFVFLVVVLYVLSVMFNSIVLF